MKTQAYFTRILFAVIAIFGFCIANSVYAQSSVKGVVVDRTTGEPIIGANIIEVGTTNGTVTDFDGNFELNVAPGSVLQISYMGYQTLELVATADMQIKLSEDAELLDEVVVVGYGVVKKNDATGSVTAIKPDDMNKGLQVNAQDMIQGKLAGVSVTSEGGGPGGKANIRIRGGSSLKASNDPLIVIDGLAMDNNGIPGTANALSMINPSDIESFTVLKDASATAIYGSRASNGVIIITTKKGSAGQKMRVTYDGNVSFSTLTNRLGVLTGDETRAYATALGLNKESMKYLGTANTDWQDQIYHTGISTDHNISLMGGTKNMPYRASVGYTLNNGIIKSSQMQRLTASINLNPTFFDKHLSINFNAKGLYIYSAYQPDGIVGSAITMDPTQPVYGGSTGIYGDVLLSEQDATNMFGGYFQPTDPASYKDPVWILKPKQNATYNPYALLKQNTSISKAGMFVGNIEGDYKIHGFEDMRLHAGFSADYTRGKQRYERDIMGTTAHYYGYSGYDDKHNYNLQFNAYAQYYKDFNPKHHFDIMAGYEWSHSYHDVTTRGNGYYQSTILDSTSTGQSLAGMPTNFGISDDASENYLVSFFGRLNYIAWNQLLLTATFRADASSRFEKGNRFGYFPSVAIGWKIKESFFKDVPWLTDWKLRLGYGITGQQELSDLGDYVHLATYSTPPSFEAYYPVGGDDNLATLNRDNQTVARVVDGNGNVLYVPLRPNAYNKDLRWEKTTTYNVGFDFDFLSNRVSGSIDYYYRRTDDLLNEVNVAAGTNFNSRVTQNVGSLSNQGVEFALNAVILDYGKKFRWDFGYNVTYNVNKIISLNRGGQETPIDVGGISTGTGNNIQQHAVGQPTYSFYVYETKEGYKENGEKFWYVVDRNGDGKVDANDQYYYHSAMAPVSMGLQLKFQFYNFDLGFSFRSNIGNYVYNDVKASKLSDVTAANFHRSNFYQGVLRECFTAYYVDNMRSDGIYADPEGKTAWNEWYRADYFVENASFLRCDNITLGYSFKKNTLAGRVYCSVSNPFVLTKYSGLDPEVWEGIDNNIYPRSMTTVVGVNLQF